MITLRRLAGGLIEYQNILYYVPKYISDQVLKYIRLHTKISQIVFQNILDCVFRINTWHVYEHPNRFGKYYDQIQKIIYDIETLSNHDSFKL